MLSVILFLFSQDIMHTRFELNKNLQSVFSFDLFKNSIKIFIKYIKKNQAFQSKEKIKNSNSKKVKVQRRRFARR
jgi:hypothetical protein